MCPANFIFKSPILFAQGWEDHQVVEEGLNVKKGDVLACILASGDNVLNLLRFEPSKIYAFDISLEQIYEFKLKLNAIKNLDHNEFLTLLGYAGEDKQRLELFNSLSKKLDVETYGFWKKNIKMIKKGFSFQGNWEKYSASWKYPLKLFVGKDYNRYVNSESISERREIYNKRLHRSGLILFSKIFTGDFFTKLLHKDGLYYKNLPNSFSNHNRFWESLEHSFVNAGCKNNQYRQWMLTGEMPDDKKYWQPYLQKENYETLKKNIDKITIINSDMFNGLKKFDENTFDGFYLSDIFDWMSEKDAEKILFEAIRVGKNKSRIVIFALNNYRKLPKRITPHVIYDKELSKRLWKKERVGLYSMIYCLEAKK